MQVDPMKLTLIAPEAMRLKLKYDEPLSNFAFNFNSRRYKKELDEQAAKDALKDQADAAAAAGGVVPPLVIPTFAKPLHKPKKGKK